YVSRTDISCTSAQCGQVTLTAVFQAAPRLCTSVSMPVGSCVLVFGQRKRSGGAIGLPLVPKPPTARITLVGYGATIPLKYSPVAWKPQSPEMYVGVRGHCARLT